MPTGAEERSGARVGGICRASRRVVGPDEQVYDGPKTEEHQRGQREPSAAHERHDALERAYLPTEARHIHLVATQSQPLSLTQARQQPLERRRGGEQGQRDHPEDERRDDPRRVGREPERQQA